MTPSALQLIHRLARKYVWWKSPEDASAMPRRVLTQVMNIGDYDDVQAMCGEFDESVLRDVIAQAEAGQFNPRSWTYWHYRLGLATLENCPSPARSILVESAVRN